MGCLICERIEMIKWHLFPRVAGDTPQKGPVWWLPKEEMWDDSKCPKDTELKTMIDELKTEIIQLLKK